MLDHVLQDMKSRFGRQQRLAMKFYTLIPAFIANVTFEELLPAIEKYEMFLSDEVTLLQYSDSGECCKYIFWYLLPNVKSVAPLHS